MAVTIERAMDAAREALARAKAGAAARGLRPGAPGRVRRKRIAGETRSTSGADERDPQLFGTGMERLVADRVPLRSDLTTHLATESIWALMDPVLFVRLTRHRGWAGEAYESWWASSVQGLLTDHPTEQPTHEEDA